MRIYFDKKNPRGGVSLKTAVLTFVALVILLCVWTWQSTKGKPADGRTEIVFWGHPRMTNQVMPAIRKFEAENPEYKVVYSVPVTQDLVGDAQRLLCAIAGEVPPDLVYFDRFAIGEWAAKGAFEDLTPFMEKQSPQDKYRIDLEDYYQFAIKEAKYKKPNSEGEAGIYGIPTSVDFRMLYMNSDILKSEGFTYEDGPKKGQLKPPADWVELRDYATKLSQWKNGHKKGKMTRLGFAPNAGNSWLYLYAWQNGGEFLSKDRTKLTMDSPPVVEALKYMTDVYDDLGGFKEVDAYQSSLQTEGALDPFMTGQLVMKIDGNWGLDYIAEFKPDMDFKLVAPPMPKDSKLKPLTWSGGYAYVMPSTAKQKEGAFKLMQFLQSDETLRFMEHEYKELQEGAGKLYLPRGGAKKSLFEAIVQEEVLDNPEMRETFKDAFKEILKIGPNTYIRPVSPVGQMLWNKHEEGYNFAVNHNDKLAEQAEKEVQRGSMSDAEYRDALTWKECELAMQNAQAPVQAQLDKVLAPPRGGKVNWSPYLWGYVAMALLPFVAIFFAYKTKRKIHGYKASEVAWSMFFASPWFIAMFVFIAGPIVFSILISFTEWDVMGDAHYVGLDNYKELTTDDTVGDSLSNTMYMLIRVPLSMILGLAIAMLMNQGIKAIGVYRTIFYLPAIMPVVASSFLWLWMLNPQSGPINGALDWLYDTSFFEWVEATFRDGKQFKSPKWFQEQVYTKPAMIVMNLWAAGSGMIIWLAGLQSIPPHLYEAARIDGAGWWGRFRHVTLPMLTPYILFNLIMGTIGTLQIFNEAFIMTQGGPENSTLFYAYYLFKNSFQYFRMGYASALAWLLFVMVLALTLLKLWSSKKWVHYQGDK